MAITLTLPWPRLLPVTIAAMTALLIVKSGTMVAAALAAPPATAKAAAEAPGHGAASHEAGEPTHAVPAVPASPAVKRDAPTPSVAVVVPPPPVPSVSSGEMALLTDLRQRRLALDAREATLVTREVAMAAVEKRLAARVDELTTLQSRLETLERQRKERDETNWRGLVKLYESMKVREAAIIFNDLDPPVLLAVLDRMKEAKAAAVLAAMLPERARQATLELAQMRARDNRIDAPSTPAAAVAGPLRPAGG